MTQGTWEWGKDFDQACLAVWKLVEAGILLVLTVLAQLLITTRGTSCLSYLKCESALYMLALFQALPDAWERPENKASYPDVLIWDDHWVGECLHLILEATSQNSWTTRLDLQVAVGANAPTFLVTVPPPLRLLHPHYVSFWSDWWVWRTPFRHQGHQRCHNHCLHPRCYPSVSVQSLWALLFDVSM